MRETIFGMIGGIIRRRREARAQKIAEWRASSPPPLDIKHTITQAEFEKVQSTIIEVQEENARLAEEIVTLRHENLRLRSQPRRSPYRCSCRIGILLDGSQLGILAP